MLVFDSPSNKRPKKDLILCWLRHTISIYVAGSAHHGRVMRPDQTGGYHPFIGVIMNDIQLASLLVNCNEKGFKEKQAYGMGYASEI